jgi:hypothetical protein
VGGARAWNAIGRASMPGPAGRRECGERKCGRLLLAQCSSSGSERQSRVGACQRLQIGGASEEGRGAQSRGHALTLDRKWKLLPPPSRTVLSADSRRPVIELKPPLLGRSSGVLDILLAPRSLRSRSSSPHQGLGCEEVGAASDTGGRARNAAENR